MADDKLVRIETKLDKIAERLNSIDVTLAGQHEQLTIHIKRTALLEEALKPVERHVAMVNGSMKLLALLAALIGAAAGLITIVGK